MNQDIFKFGISDNAGQRTGSQQHNSDRRHTHQTSDHVLVTVARASHQQQTDQSPYGQGN